METGRDAAKRLDDGKTRPWVNGRLGSTNGMSLQDDEVGSPCKSPQLLVPQRAGAPMQKTCVGGTTGPKQKTSSVKHGTVQT